MSTASRPEELFTLDMLASHSTGFLPPQGTHEAAGDWQLAYGVYSLGSQAGFGSRIGTVRVERKRRPSNEFTLWVECEKPGFPQITARLAAQVDARCERLPLPLRWSWQTSATDVHGKLLPESRLERSATFHDGVVELAGGRRKLAVAGPCTINWLLWEAVGRLPREAFSPLEFTLLHDIDRVKPGQTLRYAKSVDVVLGERVVQQTQVEELEKGRIHKTAWVRSGGGPVRLHAYHHLGDGVVPWVYWVDDQGRLLFAVCGIEAYILDSFAKQ